MVLSMYFLYRVLQFFHQAEHMQRGFAILQSQLEELMNGSQSVTSTIIDNLKVGMTSSKAC